MRKVITGLSAILFVLLGMNNSSASAQEVPAEELPAYAVDCTLQNNTPPELRTENGNFAVGSPISLELMVPNGGPMFAYFTAFRNEGEPFRLSDGTQYTVDWTPNEAGIYVIYGEFEGMKGQPIFPEDPEACVITLVVEEVPVVSEPHPPLEPPTEEPDYTLCSDPESVLTFVPIGDGSYFDVFDSEGVHCATIGDKEAQALMRAQTPVMPPAPPTPKPTIPATQEATLPVTGSSTTFQLLLAGGLLSVGGAFVSFEKKRAPR